MTSDIQERKFSDESKMEENRRKLLYISSIIPDTSCGAHIAIYRHLVVKNDFDVAVCSYSPEAAKTEKKFRIKRYKLFDRLFRSRLSRLVYNLEYLINWIWLSPSLLEYARQFQPDVIVTVPDNMHSGQAFQLAKKLNVPLVPDFQDLFPISRFIPRFMEPYSWVRKFLLRKFLKLHRNSPLVFYTSEGMMEFFGEHQNSHILYPVGDFNIARLPFQDQTKSVGPVNLVYAGNCYGAYGRMLLKFAQLVKDSDRVKLKIFPVGKGWSDDDIREMTEAGIYQNFMPFEKLKEEFAKADAFLTVMSFEEQEGPFVKTSFTTKWLDYAPYGKPIFVWGPDYSSAVIFAKKHHCGVVVDKNDPGALLEAVTKIRKDPTQWSFYSKNAKAASEDILNPEVIHSIFVRGIGQVINMASFNLPVDAKNESIIA